MQKPFLPKKGAHFVPRTVLGLRQKNKGRGVTAEPVSELERLTRKFRPPLIAFFSRRVASLAEAEDMTQEVFLRLLNAQGNSEETSAAYIFRIAANLVTDRSRHDRVRRNFADAVRSDGSAGIDGFDPFRIVSARESISVLWAAIQALPEPTQQIFILYRVENIPKQTIADNFGFHLRTVDKHISRALVFLARRMERRT
ncbi:MAG TPA: sigma-70 family RNA polymerase sigma factor [Sphingopyxis sp.]|uniref:RNA polymerase sigma factor n=1 Tax=Sphingopyxis sp. TaxID=1908224 RepID=UPI002CBB4B80|nr:sigma-70 family RNA polymerase sigma factor [Sphingopyxis sp.]HWW57159.1 sigma-70 family RNA polymerase sigma factor [Sphingopyxis sp.]